jgi:hypothetical protein
MALSAVLLAGADPPVATQPAYEHDALPLSTDALATDTQLAEEIRAANLPTASLRQLVRMAAFYDNGFSFPELSSDVRDLGFGARLRRVIRNGKQSSYTATFLVIDEAIAKRELRIRSWADDVHAVFSMYERQLPELTFECHDLSLVWTQADPGAIARYEAASTADRAPRQAASVPSELVEPYELLTDPMGDLRFGDLCGRSADWLPERAAIRALERAGRVDLISNVLRSPNPEGRVYAAESLLKRRAAGGDVADDDLRVIAAIRELEIPISCCGGCFSWTTPARELLPPVNAPATMPADE